MWVIEFKDALNLWDWKKKRVKKTKNEKVEKENLHVLVLSVSVSKRIQTIKQDQQEELHFS